LGDAWEALFCRMRHPGGWGGEDGNDSVSKRLRTALVLPFSVGVEGLVEAGGEEAGFEAGGAEDGLLGEGHAFEGEEFLGVDGVIGCDEVFAEVGDLIEVFEADYGEVVREAVFAGVLGRAVFPSGVRGPVELAALARLAASCSGETV